MGFVWDAYGICMGSWWDFSEISMDLNGRLMGFWWDLTRFSWDLSSGNLTQLWNFTIFHGKTSSMAIFCSYANLHTLNYKAGPLYSFSSDPKSWV